MPMGTDKKRKSLNFLAKGLEKGQSHNEENFSILTMRLQANITEKYHSVTNPPPAETKKEPNFHPHEVRMGQHPRHLTGLMSEKAKWGAGTFIPARQ